MTVPPKHIIIFFFIGCMLCLTMQSTFMSLSKAGKACKTQSSLNNPISEEEEHHKEQESDNDVFLNHFFQPDGLHPIALSSATWPHTSMPYFSHVADITVPPPEVC